MEGEKKEGRGGYRPNAGRKPLYKDDTLVGVTVYLPSAQAQRLRVLRKADKGINDKIRQFFKELTA